jgi:two-component system, NarL family, nitrate/nitrite response regulator NarL
LNNNNGLAAVAPSAIANDMASRPDSAHWPAVDRRRADRRQHERRSRATQPDALAENLAHMCTAREQQTVRLLLRGMTNKQIARALGIAEDTVKKHLQHAYRKLAVPRRALLLAARAQQP